MELPFTKMHGLGNDFILIDCRTRELDDVSTLAKELCDRRFGIGADQLLLLHNSDKADFKMRIVNADGSEVEMCGNGIRCCAKYIWDRALSDKKVLLIETLAGIIRPEKSGDMVKVDMGEPILEGRLIPVQLPPHPLPTGQAGPLNKGGREGVIDFPLKILDREFHITCVSMGNPHAVIIVDNADDFEVKKYGPVIETHDFFPNRVNVEFVEVVDSGKVKVRVWERGSGETLACGTGASAVAVAAHLKGLTGKYVTVELLGGELIIEWKENNHVYMTGPAVDVFDGSINII